MPLHLQRPSSEVPPVYTLFMPKTQHSTTPRLNSYANLIRLDLGDDGLSVLRPSGLSTEVAGEELALGEGAHNGLGDLISVGVEAHVLQHHHGREKESGGVGKFLTGDLGGKATRSQYTEAIISKIQAN